MPLELTRPIAFLDVQSTGLNPQTAKIVSLAVVKLMPDGSRHSKYVIVDPDMPIPPAATAIHGVSDDDVVGKPMFKAYARSLADHLENCDLGGFGIERFGAPLFEAEMRRANVNFSLEDRSVVDAMSIFHMKEPRDMAAAYEIFAGGELPTRAEGEEVALAALEIAEGQLEAYEDLPHDPAGLYRFVHPIEDNAIDATGRMLWSDEGEPVINFGKYKGVTLGTVAEEAPDYLSWMAGKQDLPESVRNMASAALAGKIPHRENEDDHDA